METHRRSIPVLLLALTLCGPAVPQSTILVSLWNDGTQTDQGIAFLAISETGRHLAFVCFATNWHPGASGWQVWTRDRDPDGNGVPDEGNEVTTLMSIGIDGLPGDGFNGGFNGHFGVAISGNGRHVMWQSQSTNLTADAVEGLPWYHVFVRDRDPDGNGVFDEGNGVTQLVDIGIDALPGNDSTNGTNRLALSTDGRCAAFSSSSTNLVTDIDTNNTGDIFVRDLIAGATERVSRGHDGSQANNSSGFPSMSADGRYVCFLSAATNLTPGEPVGPLWDVYVYDRQTQTNEKVSVSSAGVHGDMDSGAGNFSNYTGPMISPDGRFVTFDSLATNLIVPPDTNFTWDVYLRDLDAGTTVRVSETSTGGQADNGSNNPSISTDGRSVTFGSNAKLLPEDTDARPDIYAYDRLTGELERISISETAGNTNGFNFRPAITPDGRSVAFESQAFNLGPDDTNGQYDIYLRDRGSVTCPEDIDGSGDVGFGDLLGVLSNWGPCVGCPEDLDGDDEVGFSDLLIVLSTWGPCV